MKPILLIFTLFLLTSNFCIAQSKLTATVIKDGGGFTEEEGRLHEARLAEKSKNLKIKSLAAKNASKERIAREMEILARETEESILSDAKNTLHLTGERKKFELSDFEVQMAVAEALKNSNFYSYRNSGMNEQQALNMVQNDRQMDAMGEELTKSMTDLGMLIVSGFEKRRLRKEAEESERRARISQYKKQFIDARTKLNKANSSYIKNFKNSLNKNFPITKDETQLKKRVLAVVAGYSDFIFPRKFLGEYNRMLDEIHMMLNPGEVKTGSRDYTAGFVHQTINEAYFEENTLYIDITEEMKQTDADQNTMRPKSKRIPYRPLKYKVRSLIAIDVENNTSSIKRRSVWSNNAALPTSGFLNNDRFNAQIAQISDYNYAVPSSLKNNGIKIQGLTGGFNSLLNTAISELRLGMMKKNRIELKNKPEFLKNYMEVLNNDISYIRNATPFVYPNNQFKSSNKKEVSLLFLLMNKKYLIFSFPEKSKLNLLMDEEVWSKKENTNNLPKIELTSNGRRESFRQSTQIDNSFIGGNSGEDLLLEGEHPQNFDNLIYLFLLKEIFLKEASIDKNFNKDIWNPRVESGSYSIGYDSDIVTDSEVLGKLSKIGARPSSDYSSLGLKLIFRADKSGYLLPVKKNKYSNVGKVDATYKNLNESYVVKTSYYKKTDSENYLGIKFLKGVSKREPIKFSELTKYRALDNLKTNVYFSETLLNGFFRFFEGSERGSIRYIKPTARGSVNILNSMINGLADIDYSESAILNNGRSKHYNKDGVLDGIGLKIGDKKHGYWEYFYPSGALKKSCSYVTGMSMLDGEYKEFDEQGRLIKQTSYFVGDVEGVSKSYTYYTDGYHDEFSHNSDGLKHGLASTFKNDVLFQTKVFEDGVPSSEITMYHPNGQISGKFNTVNGKIQGYLKEYYPNGKIMQEGEYINGKKFGVFKTYDENGKFSKEVNYIYGVKQ